MGDELKPCPFCGNAVLGVVERDDGYAVVCVRGCGSRGQVRGLSDIAVKCWNARAAVPELK